MIQGSTAFDVRGLGLGPLPEETVETPQQQPEKGNFWDKLFDFLPKVADAYANIKNAGSNSGGTMVYTPPASSGMSTGTKVLLAALGVSIVGGTVAYLATRRKKK